MLPIMKQKPFAPALLDIYDTKKTAHLHRNHNTDTKESAFFVRIHLLQSVCMFFTQNIHPAYEVYIQRYYNNDVSFNRIRQEMEVFIV